MKRKSDTAQFDGVDCEVCKKRVKLSDDSAYWQSFPEVKAWHWFCWHAWVDEGKP